MKNRNFFIAFIVLAVIALRPAFSASLEELTGPGRAAVLLAASEPVTEAQSKNPAPRLLPRHEELRRLVNETQSGLGPNVLVETLYIYRKPAGEWSNAEQIGLFNQLAALSTLAGIQYYSASRKAMRVFYESSHVTDGPSGKTALPDPVFNNLPGALTLYARQKDLTFGDNNYRYDYRTGKDAILLTQENVTPLNYGIIPAVGKNKCRTIMAVIDAGDCLLIYAAAMAKTASVPGMGDRIGNSFSNRAVAILKWFAERTRRVFG